MMRNRILKLGAYFSRRAHKQIDPQQMQQMKQKLFEQCNKKGYRQPDLFKHQDIIYEQVVYGNKCQISGITQNNIKSCQFTRQVIQTGRPRTIILGGMNDTQAMGILQQPLNRFLNLQNLSSAKLFCKSTLLPLIQQRVQQHPNFLYDKKNKVLWKVDKMSRAFQVNDYINAAYQSLFLDYKIIYGKPSSVFIYQDLILTLSLQQLQSIFQTTLSKIQSQHPTSCQHVAAVVLQQIKNYAMYDQPKLYTKQITYTTALLNRLTKIQSKNLLLIPTCFVKKIAQNVHNVNFEPESVYRKWLQDHHSQNFGRFSQIMANKKVEQILQKFAIISILKGFHLQLVLHQGRNFFKNSIFSDLLGNYTHEVILKMYRPYKSKYMQKLFEIQKQRIKNRIQYSPAQTQYMYLKDQFETLQKRQKMFLYEYQPKNYITQVQNLQKLQNLQAKLKQIVQNECDQYEKRLIQQFNKGKQFQKFKVTLKYNKGHKSKQNIILHSKLIGKANLQLKDKVKLPYYHFNAFRGFYKQYLRQNLLFDKNKKQKQLDMKKMKNIQMNFQKIGKQLKDPQMVRKYITGQMGPVKQINMYQGLNGQIDIDAQFDDLQQVVASLGNEQMKKDFEQFRKKHPRQQDIQLGQDDQIDEDFSDDQDFQQQKTKKRK